uniref:SPOR domain-containing protein n=1 Tax=Ningiella ruwaisensis TaxID=2364274 RepID=UPI00109F1C02|nr:DamX-like protein [Ningiella ruwaisensis]
MSQLQERLQHLVHYSSQLIFVGCDSPALQQRSLSDFLANQPESNEVSFFTASAQQHSADYRRLICRQLADHQVGSFVRPLRELLQDLPEQAGTYLVCITQAQYLEDSFVLELWDWVTNAKQQNDNIHINVILFAQQAWTQKAENLLPSHQTNKPVLLSSQSLDAVGFDVSALENLMAQKRAFFGNETRQSIIRKKWFIAAVLFSFAVIFIALITWQYPEHVTQFLRTGKLDTPPSTEAQIQKEDAVTTLPQAEETSELLEQTEQESSINTLSDSSLQTPLEIVSPDSLPLSVTEELLVSNWQSEKEENPTTELTPNSAVESGSQSNNPSIVEDDFQVEDIVSVAQLNEQFSRELQSETADTASSEAIQEPYQSDSEQTMDQAYQFDEPILLNQDASGIALQLSGIQNRQVLDNYIVSNNLQDDVWVYETIRYGGPWFVVLYNRTFSSVDEASAAIASLPENIQADGPFAKRISQIQSEIQTR